MTTRVSSSSPDPILPSTAQELKAGDDGYPSSEDVDFAVIQALRARAEAAEARVQALEQERDSITRQLKADASNERECRVANQDRLRTALEQIDDLRSRLQDYAQHKDECAKRSVVVECTCGLIAPPKAQS